jgi:two-component system, NarL family, sensor histidine kinase EvgS
MRSLLLALFVALLLGSCHLYVPKSNIQDILTEEEKSWLQDHPVIYMGGELNFPPYVFFQDGRHKGIGPDFMTEITKDLGIRFESHIIDTRPRVLQALQSNAIDATFANRAAPGREFLVITQPYVFTQGVIVVRQDRTAADIRTVAVARASASAKFLELNYPQYRRIENDDDEGSLRLLANGSVDAAMMSREVAFFLMNKMGLEQQLFDLRHVEYEYYLGFGVNANNVVLHRILVKTLEAIPLARKREILQRWLKEPYL